MISFPVSAARLATRLRGLFVTRNILFHDGRSVRRFRLHGRAQFGVATAGAMVLSLSGYGAMAATGAVAHHDNTAQIAQMESQIARMQARVAAIRETAQVHAQRVEQRQALLTAVMTGEGYNKELAAATLPVPAAKDGVEAHVLAPLTKVETRQAALAVPAQAMLDRRYADTSAAIRKLGLKPERVAKRSVPAKGAAMGGEYIPANSAEAAADLHADQQFRTLFQSWKKMDGLQQGTIAIPSVQPVANLQFTSNFGIRSDPFRGTAAMHAGVDIPGPVGTPIYATADGIVSHADRRGGYGNLVEINHGKGIATRYGHLSKILVTDGARVHRGQLIALMGSTGRSTGPHLHYEVRMDGHAVNPVPFLTTADYLLASQDHSVHQIPVSTDGPAAQD
ncbi:M23 family metallopeptidase [Sphingomonas carotinifaciens]|uniref:Murein DD-endopeptidase MepM and murein hydrolase activator NlpD, contain LysM domain n=1 Tax=Sphingomonas carotinifaciens TaxID=1166323 RepID=A0A1G7J7J3_9SPHN|nr:M23 family metallopeptidase [Sphingomonas carotinifaciens]MBB4084601.1 murein DD-endopeptidase MepM/ murein hydrolase activator NlpD [Sphingomonas carotinifaciens]MWC43991.1 peptidoglycan DD-metalloendopeptidase family protein [Sphingomonas carotinifaciens]SDF20890.1 Murein DD-endopeptidase MepM and murein hydrolase activator NlpD, contain LysM domain [Sphingomonas carotinifaciens]